MSKVRADNYSNRLGTGAPVFPDGINVTGVITATTFDGNATTATTATTASGLTGTPDITVNNIVGAAMTLSGDLTVNGTTTIINTQVLDVADKNIGIGSTSTPSDSLADGAGITIYGDTNKTLTYNNTKKALETNIPWATNETRIVTGAEKITRVDGNTVNLSYNSLSSNVAICTNPSGNLTLNVTGIPETSDFDSHSITFAVISNATGTAYSCLTVNLNDYTSTILWAGGDSQIATAGVTTSSGYTMYSFTGINTVGSAATTANYAVFGIVSGGFF